MNTPPSYANTLLQSMRSTTATSHANNNNDYNYLYTILGLGYIVLEILFYVYFHRILIPTANAPLREQQLNVITKKKRLQNHNKDETTTGSTTATDPSLIMSSMQGRELKNPYREPYHIHKHLLLRRILHRILHDTQPLREQQQKQSTSSSSSMILLYDPQVVKAVATHYITSWFDPEAMPKTTTTTTTSSTTTTTTGSRPATDPTMSKHTRSTIKEQVSNISSYSSGSDMRMTSTTTTNTNTGTTSTDQQSSSSTASTEDDAASMSSTEDTTVVSTTTTTTERRHMLPPPPIPPQIQSLRRYLSKSETPANAESEVSTSSLPRLFEENWTIPHICKGQMNDFFAWGFFHRRMEEMSSQDLLELDKCFLELQTTLQLVFYDAGENDDDDPQDDHDELEFKTKETSTRTATFTTRPTMSSSSSSSSSSLETKSRVNSSSSLRPPPRRISFEPVNAWHRPILIYVICIQ
jgi:hypothetical protein